MRSKYSNKTGTFAIEEFASYITLQASITEYRGCTVQTRYVVVNNL